MTLLVTVARSDYALSCSDMRITTESGNSYKVLDERFNKHILFHSGGLTGNVTYTGFARWNDSSGKIVKVYDVISNSIAQSAHSSLKFSSLCMNLCVDLLAVLERPRRLAKLDNAIIELHIVGYHSECPYPMMAVISTFRKINPWLSKNNFEWEYHFDGLHIYFKAADKPEVIIGGMDTCVRKEEKAKLHTALAKGADAFDISRMASRLVETVSTRTKAVGRRSVSVVIPQDGLVDTNLWDKTQNGIIGFVPRMIFPNGQSFGPSEFPVELSLLLDCHLPKNNLFFKTIISSEYKRRFKRIIFRYRKGKAVPSLMGIIMLALFGEVPDEYSDFGLFE